MRDLNKLQQHLRYHFSDQNLLEEALTHPSHSVGTQHPNHHYQRLEWLGDSVLNLVITETLFKNFPREREGILAKMRNHYVSGKTLVEMAQKIDLAQHICIGPKEPSQLSNTHHVLEDCMEAIFGAIYFDGGLHAARDAILPFYDDIASEYAISPKNILQEKYLPTAQFPQPVQYAVSRQTGPDHAKHYTVTLIIYGKQVSTGSGSSKKLAEIDAAQRYLETLI